jgi:hypothetical protein
MVQKGMLKKPVQEPCMPQERLRVAENLLGGPEGICWHLVSVSCLATPRTSPEWKTRREQLPDFGLHDFLQELRKAGFRTRAGHGGRFVQEKMTKGFVRLM